MVRTNYKPKQGNIIFFNFSPQRGREQRGGRPALVISGNVFNESTGFVLVCPITTKDNKFPLHIALPEDTSTVGFVLTEHIKSIDWRARKISFIEKAPSDFVGHILDIVDSFYR